MRYIKSVRFSEQSLSVVPRFSAAGMNGPAESVERLPNGMAGQNHSRDRLVHQADQVQAAIYSLIRSYEATTGHSVIRLEYDAQARRITLDALPLAK
jgi:hypothetical protein